MRLGVEVPDRHEQAVRAERTRVPGAFAQPEFTGRGEPRKRLQQQVLLLRSHPAKVRLLAGQHPVRARAEPFGRHDRGIRPLE